MYYFLHHVTIAKWHYFTILRELINQKFLTIKAELIIRVPASTNEQPHTKNCGGQSYATGISKKWHYQYNDYSAKKTVDMGKYASENGAMKACMHFTRTLGKPVSKSTVRRVKATCTH